MINQIKNVSFVCLNVYVGGTETTYIIKSYDLNGDWCVQNKNEMKLIN